jgi:hypothetical protein
MKSKLRSAVAVLAALGYTIMPLSALAGASVTQDVQQDSGLVCLGAPAANAIVACFRSKGVWHEVTTPSGNMNNTLNATWTQTLTTYGATGAVSSTLQSSGDDHTKMLFKPGEVTKGHSFTQSDMILGADGSCVTTTIEYDYNFTTNTVMQDNYTVSYSAC